jgi:hypothetical protein
MRFRIASQILDFKQLKAGLAAITSQARSPERELRQRAAKSWPADSPPDHARGMEIAIT